MEHKERLETLEKLVDESSLPEVAEDLAEVCRLKAEHVLSNWQDKSLSAFLSEAAKRFTAIAVWFSEDLESDEIPGAG